MLGDTTNLASLQTDHSRRVSSPLLAPWRYISALYRHWAAVQQNKRSVEYLASMPDYLLKDIGLTRAQANDLARKPSFR
jgi:uncharacterized protein YjiS (DUF1127 family)